MIFTSFEKKISRPRCYFSRESRLSECITRIPGDGVTNQRDRESYQGRGRFCKSIGCLSASTVSHRCLVESTFRRTAANFPDCRLDIIPARMTVYASLRVCRERKMYTIARAHVNRCVHRQRRPRDDTQKGKR